MAMAVAAMATRERTNERPCELLFLVEEEADHYYHNRQTRERYTYFSSIDPSPRSFFPSLRLWSSHGSSLGTWYHLNTSWGDRERNTTPIVGRTRRAQFQSSMHSVNRSFDRQSVRPSLPRSLAHSYSIPFPQLIEGGCQRKEQRTDGETSAVVDIWPSQPASQPSRQLGPLPCLCLALPGLAFLLPELSCSCSAVLWRRTKPWLDHGAGRQASKQSITLLMVESLAATRRERPKQPTIRPTIDAAIAAAAVLNNSSSEKARLAALMCVAVF